MPKHRRTRYLVHRGLQGRFTRVLMGISLLYLIGYVYVVVSTQQQLSWTLGQVLFSCEALSPVMLEQIQVLDQQRMLQLISIGAVIVLVVAILGVLVTHRLAGPLVRIHTALAVLPRTAAVPPLRLRKGDELAEIATEVNRLSERLHEDAREDLRRIDELRAGLEPLGSEGRESLLELLEALRDARRGYLAE